MPGCELLSLEPKYHHFNKILITGYIGIFHFDNFQRSKWWKFHQNDENICFSEYGIFIL